MTPVPAVDSLHEVAVHGITSEGAGVGRMRDGRAVFVHRTAPGDRVRIRLSEVRKRWARARLVEVIEPSDSRRPPPCPHYERCGGCTLEHIEYDAQLEAKASWVTAALERIGKLSGLPQPEMHPSPSEFRYRNRVTFTLRRGEARSVVAGFHELENPAELVDLDGQCLLPEEPIAVAWDGLRASWGAGAARLPSGSELRLTLRSLSGGEVVLFVEGGHVDAEAADAQSLLADVPGLDAIWHRPHARGAAVLLAGTTELVERWHGEEFVVHPGVFLQANRRAAEHLHEMVLRAAGSPRGRKVIDAYAGIGSYGRRLARHGASVISIESNPVAAEIAEKHGTRDFRMILGRVEDRLPEALPSDLVILNPPRVGVREGVMELLGASRPERVLYVSCDPATLARDLRRLGDGYRITRLQVFDLFPQTAHIETLATLDAIPLGPGAPESGAPVLTARG